MFRQLDQSIQSRLRRGIAITPKVTELWEASKSAGQSPFLAANALLREEVDFGGTFTIMTGWAWRGDESGHLCRAGLQAVTGKTTQFEFHDRSETLVGLGVWYDF